MNQPSKAFPETSILGPLVAGIAVTTIGFDWTWSIWTADAQWVWPGFQSALISTGEIGLAMIALTGWLRRRGDRDSSPGDAPGQSVVTVAGIVLLAFVGLSAIGAVAPLLSVARFFDVAAGFLASLAIARESALRHWLIVAILALVVVQLPLVLVQQLTQSTFPLHTVALPSTSEIPASAPGAFVLQLPGGVRWQRSIGSFPHPNVLGGFAATAIVLTLPFLRAPTAFRWPAIAIWILAWVELALSFSRAGAIAASVGCIVWGIAEVRTFQRVKVAIPLALAMFVLLGVALDSRGLAGDTSLPASGPAVSERLLLARVAGDMLREHPMTGVGAGNFPLVESLPPYDGVMVDPVHAVPLLVAAEAGLPAGVAWLILVIGPAVIELRSRVRSPTGSYHRIAVAVTLLIIGSLDHYFWTLSPGRTLFWIAVGAGVT